MAVPAIVAASCCCEPVDPVDCGSLPTSVLVTWTGSASLTWNECVGDCGFADCPITGTFTASGISTTSTLYESPPGTCAYAGSSEATTRFSLTEITGCEFCPDPGSVISYSVTRSIGSPYTSGGFWYVNIGLTYDTPNPPDSLGAPSAYCNYDHTFGTGGSIGIYKGPADTLSPVGTYSPDWSVNAYGYYFFEEDSNGGLTVSESVGTVTVA